MRTKVHVARSMIVMSVVLALFTGAAWAAPSERDLVAESVEVLVRTGGGEGLAANDLRARSGAKLEAALAGDADFRVHARMAFSQSVSAAELVDLAERRGVRVLMVESKVPTADEGEVYTAWFGGLSLLEGTLGEQLGFFEDHFRSTWEGLAERRRLTGRAADRPGADPGRLLEDPSRYYLIEVVAPAAELLALDRRGAIAALVVHGDGAGLESALDRAPKRALTALSLAEGRPSSAMPERGMTGKMGVVAPCGGTTGGAENCPPDATWLPSSSFGLGADSDFSSLVVSHLGPTVFTEGDFYTQVRWAPVSPPLARINTAAFVDSSAKHCDPDISVSLSAPCDRSDRDAVYVPNATFESEGLVPNNFCALPLRTGTSADINAGCFLPTFGFTNLPSAYLDTTFADSRTPFNAAIGTVAPDRIFEGFTYETYVYFWAFGFEVVVGQKAKHIGQIGTDTFPCPFPSQFCVFAVDTTKLDEATYLPVIVF